MIQDTINNSRLIAKLQHFADAMNHRKLEKEALSIAITEKSLKSDIRKEILIYEEIIEEYNSHFREILYLEDL